LVYVDIIFNLAEKLNIMNRRERRNKKRNLVGDILYIQQINKDAGVPILLDGKSLKPIQQEISFVGMDEVYKTIDSFKKSAPCHLVCEIDFYTRTEWNRLVISSDEQNSDYLDSLFTMEKVKHLCNYIETYFKSKTPTD
jgi:hypothetical protein